MSGNPLAPGGNGPDRNVPASAVVMELINRGRPPSALVPFPRFDAAGKPVAMVRIRLLKEMEQMDALANARKEVARLTANSNDLAWRPEEMEHNARAVEILAIAVRRVQFVCVSHPLRKAFYPHKCSECQVVMTEWVDDNNLDPPMFEHGVMEARRYCTAPELGVLMNAYATLQSRTHPNLNDLTVPEMREWLKVIVEGLHDLPFSFFSRDQLEILTRYYAECVVELERRLAGLEATSSLPSAS